MNHMIAVRMKYPALGRCKLDVLLSAAKFIILKSVAQQVEQQNKKVQLAALTATIKMGLIVGGSNPSTRNICQGSSVGQST